MGLRDWIKKRTTPKPSPGLGKVFVNPGESTGSSREQVVSGSGGTQGAIDTGSGSVPSGITSGGGGGGSSGNINIQQAKSIELNINKGIQQEQEQQNKQKEIRERQLQSQRDAIERQKLIGQNRRNREILNREKYGTRVEIKGGRVSVGSASYIGNATVPNTGGLTANEYSRKIRDEFVSSGKIDRKDSGRVTISGTIREEVSNKEFNPEIKKLLGLGKNNNEINIFPSESSVNNFKSFKSRTSMDSPQFKYDYQSGNFNPKSVDFSKFKNNVSNTNINEEYYKSNKNIFNEVLIPSRNITITDPLKIQKRTIIFEGLNPEKTSKTISTEELTVGDIAIIPSVAFDVATKTYAKLATFALGAGLSIGGIKDEDILIGERTIKADVPYPYLTRGTTQYDLNRQPILSIEEEKYVPAVTKKQSLKGFEKGATVATAIGLGLAIPIVGDALIYLSDVIRRTKPYDYSIKDYAQDNKKEALIMGVGGIALGTIGLGAIGYSSASGYLNNPRFYSNGLSIGTEDIIPKLSKGQDVLLTTRKQQIFNQRLLFNFDEGLIIRKEALPLRKFKPTLLTEDILPENFRPLKEPVFTIEQSPKRMGKLNIGNVEDINYELYGDVAGFNRRFKEGLKIEVFSLKEEKAILFGSPELEKVYSGNPFTKSGKLERANTINKLTNLGDEENIIKGLSEDFSRDIIKLKQPEIFNQKFKGDLLVLEKEGRKVYISRGSLTEKYQDFSFDNIKTRIVSGDVKDILSVGRPLTPKIKITNDFGTGSAFKLAGKEGDLFGIQGGLIKTKGVKLSKGAIERGLVEETIPFVSKADKVGETKLPTLNVDSKKFSLIDLEEINNKQLFGEALREDVGKIILIRDSNKFNINPSKSETFSEIYSSKGVTGRNKQASKLIVLEGESPIDKTLSAGKKSIVYSEGDIKLKIVKRISEEDIGGASNVLSKTFKTNELKDLGFGGKETEEILDISTNVKGTKLNSLILEDKNKGKSLLNNEAKYLSNSIKQDELNIEKSSRVAGIINARISKRASRSKSSNVFVQSEKQDNKQKQQQGLIYETLKVEEQKQLNVNLNNVPSFKPPRIRPPLNPLKRIITPIVPFFKLGKIKRPLRKVKTYTTLVKRRGKFVAIGSGNVLDKALKIGSNRTLRTLARTFKVVESGSKEVFNVDNIGKADFNYFRNYKIRKGKKIYTPNLRIQKTKALLQTREEKSAIKKAKRNASQINKLIGIKIS